MTEQANADQDAADKAAMARLREGDDLALNAIMEHWENPLITFLYRYTANWSVAVDLAQETFVKIYQSRARYRPKGMFSTWMFAIAANLARNEARWRKRHPGSAFASAVPDPGDAEGPLRDIAANQTGPDEAAERRERARLVKEAIRKLPHDFRTVVLLAEYENLSHREIGEVLGCSPKAVESRLYRARKQLGELLSGVLS